MRLALAWGCEESDDLTRYWPLSSLRLMRRMSKKAALNFEMSKNVYSSPLRLNAPLVDAVPGEWQPLYFAAAVVAVATLA